MASFTHNNSIGRTRMQSNLVSPEPASRQRTHLNKRVIEGCDYTVKDEICNNLVELSSCPILHEIPDAENAIFVNNVIWDIQMFEQFLAYHGHRQSIPCPKTNVSLPRYKFERKSRLSTGEATSLVQQSAGHPLTERQARSFLERLMLPRTLGDTVSASRFVRGAHRLKSEMKDKVADYENFVRVKASGARSNVPESSRRTSQATISSNNSESYQPSISVTPERVQEESRYRTDQYSRHSTPTIVSPDHSVGYRTHLSHRASSRSSAEPTVLFPTTLSSDYSSALSQQDFLYSHSRRRHQPRAVSPEQDVDLQTAIALQNSLSMQSHFSTSQRSLSAAAPQQRTSCHGVYIAGSRKGKCYHSNGTCSGLRSASCVTSVSLEHASDMLGMRPCKICRPQSSTLREQRTQPLLQSSAAWTPSTSYSVQVSSRSSSLYASGHSTKTYWITRTGQCYHSSRSCSSLRRSKVVTASNGKPTGKRPCSHCC